MTSAISYSTLERIRNILERDTRTEAITSVTISTQRLSILVSGNLQLSIYFWNITINMILAVGETLLEE